MNIIKSLDSGLKKSKQRIEMAKNRTRRNKTEGGKRKNKNKSEGGRRKTRKASSWTKSVTALYHKMKKEDSSIKFSDALKKGAELKKKGQL